MIFERVNSFENAPKKHTHCLSCLLQHFQRTPFDPPDRLIRWYLPEILNGLHLLSVVFHLDVRSWVHA